jgi:hypothetical protein
MNKKVSLAIIQRPDLDFSYENYVISKEGKILPTTSELIDNPELKNQFTPIEVYFVDDQPILPNNRYISYVPTPNVKTHTEIDHVLNKGQFKKGERRIYLTEKDVRWTYNPEDKKMYQFASWHLNQIVDKGFTCYIMEANLVCDGTECLYCNCYEYNEDEFHPNKIEDKFVIVI